MYLQRRPTKIQIYHIPPIASAAFLAAKRKVHDDNNLLLFTPRPFNRLQPDQTQREIFLILAVQKTRSVHQ
jgi:hypothetical protein